MREITVRVTTMRALITFSTLRTLTLMTVMTLEVRTVRTVGTVMMYLKGPALVQSGLLFSIPGISGTEAIQNLLAI